MYFMNIERATPPKKISSKKIGTQMEKELSQTETLRTYFRNLKIFSY